MVTMGVFSFQGTMVLGSTQPLVKMSARNISVGKGGWCVRLTTSPQLHVPNLMKIWEPKLPETLGVTAGLLGDDITFFKFYMIQFIR